MKPGFSRSDRYGRSGGGGRTGVRQEIDGIQGRQRCRSKAESEQNEQRWVTDGNLGDVLEHLWGSRKGEGREGREREKTGSTGPAQRRKEPRLLDKSQMKFSTHLIQPDSI